MNSIIGTFLSKIKVIHWFVTTSQLISLFNFKKGSSAFNTPNADWALNEKEWGI